MTASSPSNADMFSFHRAHPEVSAELHLQRRSKALGQALANTRKIYLDVRFWLHLRDAERGRPRHPVHTQLLERFTALADRHLAVFPLSDAIALEVLKQKDLGTRQATARLIDRLGQGVALTDEELRCRTELAHFLHLGTPDILVHPLKELAWTCPMFVLGARYPQQTPFPPETERVIQKAFIDRGWTIPFEQLLDSLKNLEDPVDDLADVADRLNALNREHEHELRTFQKAVIDEMVGVVDLMRETIADVRHRQYQHFSGSTAAPTPDEWERHAQHGFSIVANAITAAPLQVGLRLPTPYIKAKCYAAVRWNRGQKLSGNDIYDFTHAAPAVGYCDAFFTDGPLARLLNSNQVNLAQEFGCFVESDEQAIADYAAQLLVEPDPAPTVD
ncbi:hypothetical protein [Solimonas fluminis]|jgi:hypothetical protein|nr:hypothetical protein [Solimonas fluminis]